MMQQQRTNQKIGWWLATLMMLALAGMAFAQTEGTETDANADLLNHIDNILDEEIPDLVAMGRGERQGPWEDVGDIERNIDYELQTGGQWDGNQITSNDNPLLTETCHEDAMRAALHEMMDRKDLDQNGAVEMARKHMGERQAAFREGGTTYSDYIAHIASCKAFCGPMVKKLIGCHILAVKSLEHDMVFFPFDSYEVKDLRSQEAINRIGRSIRQDPTKSVLLIGRASRIGPLGYNRRLSGLRARAVGEQLNDLGVGQERIQTLTFGWEPPQIDARIADAYNLADLYNTAGKNRTNQSVIMVVY